MSRRYTNPSYVYYANGCVREYPQPDTTYVGFEIEYEGAEENECNDCADAITAYLGDKVWCKSDGSLYDGGVECVTHPMDIQEVFNTNWDLMTDTANDYGCYSEDGCGFHVHVSRSGLTWLQTAGIVRIFDRFYKRLRWLGGRYNGETAHEWARRNSWGWDEMSDERMKELALYGEASRYRAVNLQNGHTIEIRLFASTQDSDQIKFIGDLVNSIVKIAKSTTIGSIGEMSWNTFKDLLIANAYDSELMSNKITQHMNDFSY